MALLEMQVPLPEVSIEAKRELPDFVLEEQRAVRRLASPDIRRPVRPSYAFIRNRTIDLETQFASLEMMQWVELRRLMLSQANHPRWVGSVTLGNEIHTLGWYSVLSSGETMPDHFCTLRCSCSLPAVGEPDTQEYVGCGATDIVIEARAEVFREALGNDSYLDDMQGIPGAIAHIVEEAKKDRLLWPPSHRSDVFLVDGLAMTFGVRPARIMDAGKILEENGVVQINNTEKPYLSLVDNLPIRAPLATM